MPKTRCPVHAIHVARARSIIDYVFYSSLLTIVVYLVDAIRRKCHLSNILSPTLSLLYQTDTLCNARCVDKVRTGRRRLTTSLIDCHRTEPSNNHSIRQNECAPFIFGQPSLFSRSRLSSKQRQSSLSQINRNLKNGFRVRLVSYPTHLKEIFDEIGSFLRY